MTKILIHGIKGVMGQEVYKLLEPIDVLIVGFEKTDCEESYIYSNLNNIGPVDVIIDFSHHTLIDSLLDYAQINKTPTVICTTGLNDDTKDKIQRHKKDYPIFKSGNMSLGINVLIELAKIGAKVLSDFDVKIIEKHHNKKVDAPSGTAYMIAKGIKEIHSEHYLTYGRSGNTAKREKREIGIHAIRGGTITGEHTVLFAGLDENIEIKHQATSKAVFAKGAVEAAFFILSKNPGLYTMTDLITGGQ